MSGKKYKTVREMYLDAGTWTQNDYAYTSDGTGCGPYSDAACCWCLSGAIMLIYDDSEAYISALNRVHDVLDKRGYARHIPSWNDALGRTQAEVLELVIEANV